MNYYNEHDPYAAAWLRNLISAGLIPAGEVDERSIEDVRPVELRGFTQCHFFAGIGGWPLALDLAGWPRSLPVWTGSCPCQPFSAAGRGDGFADERHLWPAWFHLIRECRPIRVFGEQVASAIGHGWYDLVSADMEAEGYAIGGAVLGAHSVGAPHQRQRLYWMADASGTGLEGRQSVRRGADECATRARGMASGMADTDRTGLQPGVGDVSPARHGDSATAAGGDDRHGSAGAIDSPWRSADWLRCRDGKWRPVEPGTFPLDAGLPRGLGTSGTWLRGLARMAGLDSKSLKRAKQYRVETIRGYGNAIVPQTAAAFIRAGMSQAA